ncbi:hypothetical protein RhiirB3_420006, partial [Rhizophagus irregularis]
MLSIFLFLDLNDDVVVTIAVVVVIGEAGVGVGVASVGVGIAGDSVDAYLSFLLYQIGPYREFQLTPRNQNSEGRAWYRRYGIYKQQ